MSPVAMVVVSNAQEKNDIGFQSASSADAPTPAREGSSTATQSDSKCEEKPTATRKNDIVIQFVSIDLE